MRKLCRRTLAGFLVLAMTLGSWLPVSAEETETEPASEAYAPELEGTNFFANGIPVVIDELPDQQDGALISWEAGNFEGTDTTWEAGSMEVSADTVVYGGGYEGSYETTSVTMNGGTVGAIYGGGVQGETADTSVILNSGTVTGEVFGGGEYTAAENTYVEVTAAPDADAPDEPAVSVKGIYMGNAADTNVSKKATVVIKNNNDADNAVFTEELAISAAYQKIAEENGTEVVAKAGGIAESAEAVVIFDDYNGEFRGTIAEDVDTITVSDTTDADNTGIVLPADMKDAFASKIGSEVITFAEDSEKAAEEETVEETAEETAEEVQNDAQPADRSDVAALAEGDVTLSDDVMYMTYLYPDTLSISRVIAHFYKQDPTGTAGMTQTDEYDAEMTSSTADTFLVRVPADTSYQYVRFTYIDENDQESDIRMSYQFRGTSSGDSDNKEYVKYEAGKKDCIFVGLNGQRSYVSSHLTSAEELLANHVLYINMEGSGYQLFDDGDGQKYLKLYYGDGEDDFYKVTAKASMNDDCYSFVFPENSAATTSTRLRLIDARINTVGQEVEAQTRFYYGLKTGENMITPANLMNDQSFWGVYEAKLTGETRTIYFDNFLSALTQPTVSYYIAGSGGWFGSDWSGYENMTKYNGDFSGGTYVWTYEIPAEATQVRFRGTNGTEHTQWTSEGVDLTSAYDYPCWYASLDKKNETYANRELVGYWSSLYDVNTAGDQGVNIKSGTFNQEQDVYYATADFYDYYSDSELSGGSPYDNAVYDRQGDTFNLALSKYYSDKKIDPSNTLYFGGGGTKGLNEEESLYGYDPNTHQNGWDGSGITRKTMVTGIVDDTLTNGTMTQDGLESPLFDASWLRGANDYRTALGQAYENVLFPFTMNDDGYWEFDSAQADDAVVLREDVNEGYYLERTGKPLMNPETVGTTRYGFFPYDDGTDGNIDASKSGGHQRNNMSGVKMSIPFSLTEDKKILDSNGDEQDIQFSFSGDDDVWLFIDGQLVLDLGGIHDSAGATINFRTGEITYPSSGDYTTYVNLDRETVNSRKNFVANLEANTTHTITMFYMERGLEASNLKMTFNFLQSAQLQVSNSVTIPEEINSVFDEALSHLGGFQYELKNQAVSGKTTPVENSAGYIQAGASTAVNITGVQGKEKITMTNDADAVTYKNELEQTLDVGANNQAAIDARLGTINTSFNVSNYKYLRMEINSSLSSQSGASLYIALVDNGGNRIGGWANTATYDSNSNSLYANDWSTVRIDISKLRQIQGSSFNRANVTDIQIGFRSPATLQVRNLKLYEAMQQQQTTGFQVSLDQISDYGSVESKALSNADGAVYELYDSADAASGKISMVDNGTFALADQQHAVFTDKFRYGSYIYLNQAAEENVFDTTWSLTEGDTTIAPGYLAANRGNMNTVENGNVNSLTDVSGTTVNDGRTSVVNGNPVTLSGAGSAFVYRNYIDPDDTITKPVNLKVAYENTLLYGSVTVEKRIDLTGLSDEQIEAYKNSSYEFRLVFANVAGRALEQQVGDGSMLDASLTVKVGDTVQEIDGTKYLVGTATFDGVPAGTFYQIKEVQQDGISVTKVAAGESQVAEGGTAHSIWEIASPDGQNAGENADNITDKEAHATGIAYESGQSYIFTNKRTEDFEITVRKDWRTASGTNEGGSDQVYVWLQRSDDGGKTWTDVPKPDSYTNPSEYAEVTERYIAQTSGDDHTATFTGLASIVNGKACTYRVREYTVSNYTPIYSVETNGTLVVSNIPTDEVLYVQSGTFNSLSTYVQQAIGITGLTSAVKITDANGNDQTNNEDLFKITTDDSSSVTDIAYKAPSTGSATYNFEFTFTNEGGDTQTANADVLIYAYAIQNDIYVLDYGLPAELSDQTSKDNLFANDTYEIDENTDSEYKVNEHSDLTQTSGDLDITDKDNSDTWQTDTTSVVYTPKKFMDTIDTFQYTTTIYGDGNTALANNDINPTNGVLLTADIKVMPADVVYYEDTFTAQNDDSETGIVYKGTIDVETGNGVAEDIKQSIDQDTAYGYDEAYNGDNNDSLGSGHKLEAVANSNRNGVDYVNTGYAEFTFTGTGFEVVGRTDQNTTKIVFTIWDVTNNKFVKSGIVDGYYEGNDTDETTLYQLPVVKATDMNRSKYQVTLQMLCRSYESGKEGYFVLDGIRVYNPLDVKDTTDYNAKEQGTTVECVRDMILGSSDLANQGVLDLTSIPEGAKAALMSNDGTNTDLEAMGATVTEVLGDDSFATNSLDDYLVSGPKGEIYLPGGSAVAFVAEADPNTANKTMQIEAKTVNTSTADTASTLLNVGDAEQQTISINSKTAMYYELDMSLCKHVTGNKYLVILTNQPGGADISLTNLKYKGYTISYPDSTLYNPPESVVIDNETSTGMGNALNNVYNGLTTSEDVNVVSAYFANRSVKAGDSVYLNVTLKDSTKSYVPVVYQYNAQEGTMENITADEAVIDQSTLRAVRTYEKTENDATSVYRVFRIKLTAADTMSGDTFFAVGACNENTYCTLDKVKKVAILVDTATNDSNTGNEPDKGSNEDSNGILQSEQTTGNAISSVNDSTVMSEINKESVAVSGYSANSESAAMPSSTEENTVNEENIQANEEESVEVADQSAEIEEKDTETEDTQTSTQIQTEETEEEVESTGFFEGILQGIQSFFSNISNKLSGLFR